MRKLSLFEVNASFAAPWQRLAILVWVVLVAGSCIRCVVSRSDRDVGIFAVYAEAGRHWIAGTDLYPTKDAWESFLYSPAVAAALVPYSLLPPPLGNICWRLSVSAGYLFGLRWWLRAVPPYRLTRSENGLIYLLVLPVTAMTILDGQAGGLVAASMLLTVAAAADERWWTAAVFAAPGCLLKVYPIALVLLIVVPFWRRAALPFALVLLAGFAIPFLCQRPAYVADQYGKWIAMMAASDRQTWSVDLANRDVALLFHSFGAPLSRGVWLALQLGSAAGAAALCWTARRCDWSRQSLLLLIQGLAACWMTLFGPVVESFTYILVGPGLAWLLVDAWQSRRAWTYRGVLALSWSIFLSTTVAIVLMHSIRYHRLGPHPVAGLLLLGAILTDAFGRFRGNSAAAMVKPDARMAA